MQNITGTIYIEFVNPQTQFSQKKALSEGICCIADE